MGGERERKSYGVVLFGPSVSILFAKNIVLLLMVYVVFRCGPLFAPVVGGALTGRWGWRATQWFLAIYGVVVLLLMTFCLPETLREKPKQKEIIPEPELEKTIPENADGLERSISHISPRTKKKSREWAITAKHILIDPLKSLKYLRFPPVLLTVFYASMAFSCLVRYPIDIPRFLAWASN